MLPRTSKTMVTSTSHLLTVVLFLLVTVSQHVVSLKTFCKKGESRCDTTWVPVDNLEARYDQLSLFSTNFFFLSTAHIKNTCEILKNYINF